MKKHLTAFALFVCVTAVASRLYSQEVKSFYSIDGNTTELLTGHIFYRGAVDKSFHLTLSFCSAGATLNRDGWGAVNAFTPFTGDGKVLSFDLFTKVYKSVPAGTYKPDVKGKKKAGSFHAAALRALSAASGTSYPVFTLGKVSVSVSKEVYVIRFLFRDENGNSLHGVYQGKLSFDEVIQKN